MEGGEKVAAENDATRLFVTSVSRSCVRTVAMGLTGGCETVSDRLVDWSPALAGTKDSSGVPHVEDDGEGDGIRSSSISNTIAKPSSSGADLVSNRSSLLHTGVMLRDRLT